MITADPSTQRTRDDIVISSWMGEALDQVAVRSDEARRCHALLAEATPVAIAEQTPPMPQNWGSQRWERGTRYYTVILHQDLWGAWVITRVHGSRTSCLGRVVHLPQPSYAAACASIAAINRRRTARHYRSVAALGSPLPMASSDPP